MPKLRFGLSFLLGASLGCLFFWLSGYNFDHRGAEACFALFAILYTGVCTALFSLAF